MTFQGTPLLRWGDAHRRELPWRRTRDPWLVLVSEVMLQQTQAPRVVPRWLEWCDRFPTPSALADVPLGDALRAWQGLGYPRRARNLHLAAGAIVERHDGHVPDELDQLLALPGIGPYTARAVLAFAFQRDVGVVDTNIARVLARTAGRRLTGGEAQALADAIVPPGEGWAWNQSLMDVGAELCRPTPSCERCPLRASCAWRLAGKVAPDPAAGSAGVSARQAPFEGSDRQARGAVLRRLGEGPAAVAELDSRIVAGLVADGLIVERLDGAVSLP